MAPAYDALVPVAMTSGHYDLIGGGYYIDHVAGPLGDEAQPAARNRRFWTSDSLASQGFGRRYRILQVNVTAQPPPGSGSSR